MHGYLLGQQMDVDLYVQSSRWFPFERFVFRPLIRSRSSVLRPLLWVIGANAHGQNQIKIFVCCALEVFDCVRIGLGGFEYVR